MSVSTHIGIAILGAGRGSRLAPLTDQCPKPLLPFLGNPLLEHLLPHLATLAPHAMAINTHHLADAMTAWAATYRKEAGTPTFQLIEEAMLTGSGGGLRTLTHHMPDANLILYHNADIVTDVDMSNLIVRHQEQKAVATLLTVPAARADGNIRITNDLTHIHTLPSHRGPATAPARAHDRGVPRTFGGIAVLNRDFLMGMPPLSAPCLVRDLLTPALMQNAPIAAYDTTERWHDVGTPARLFDALRDYGHVPNETSHAFADERSPYITSTVTLTDGRYTQRFMPQKGS